MIHCEQLLNKTTGVVSEILVSYHDEHGKKQLIKFNIPPEELFEWEETTDKNNSHKVLTSAHGKLVRKVPLKRYRNLSKFRVYELFNNLPKDVKEKIYYPHQPIKTFFDIETESDERSFPDVNNPKHKVLTNAFVTGNEVYLMGMLDFTPEDIVTMERGLMEHFSTLKNKSLIEKPYKIKYQKFDSEQELVTAIYRYINDEVHMLLGWNCLKFDMLYLANRSVNMTGLDVSKIEKKNRDYPIMKMSSPSRNKFDIRIVDKFSPDVKISVPVPYHVPVLDYMEVMEKFDYPKRSKYSLDYVSDEVLEGVKKVSFGCTLQELYDRDPVKFCLYNIVDTILVQLIDKATDIFSIVPTLASVVEVPIHDALFAGMMCERKFQSFYYDKKKVFISSFDSDEVGTYEGGLVKPPIEGVANYIMIYDFTSKFPSGMMSFNLGIDTLLGYSADKKTYISDESGKKIELDLNTSVLAPNGYVYDKTKGDSSLRTMVFDLFNGRVECKVKAKDVEKEIQLLERLKVGDEFPKFSYCTIKEDELDDKNLVYQELEKLEKLAKKFANESQAMKIIMNSIYGVLGYRYFPLYNVAVASTVTAQSRDLLQYTIDITNKFFMESWLDATDLHEQLGITVKNNVPREIVYYADTDSLMINMEHVLDSTDWEHKKDFEKTRDFLLSMDKIVLKPFYKKSFDEYCDKWGAFRTRPDGKDSFQLGLEEIDFKILFVKKKRYIKNPIWADGKLYKPNEKLSYKGVEMAKPSFPKFIRNKLKQIMENIMAQDGKLDMFSVCREARLVRDEFMNAQIDDICEIVRVNNFTNSVISENPLMFVSGAPQNHRASAIHNNLIKTDPDLKRFPLITNGQKVGVYMTSGVEKTNDVFAYPVMLGVPEKAPQADRRKQFERMILSPINNIIKKIDPNLQLNYDLYVVDSELW